MILRISFLILLGTSLGLAQPNKSKQKDCRSDKKYCLDKKNIPAKKASAPKKKAASPKKVPTAEIYTNSANLIRLDSEGFTVKLDCSKFGTERAKDAKDFLLEPNIPEECQKNSPAYNQKVLILMNPVVVNTSKEKTDEK